MNFYKRIFVISIFLTMFFSVSASATATTYVYDDLGRVSSITYSTGEVVNYTYDKAGNRTARAVTGSIFNSDPNEAKVFVLVPLNGFTIIQGNNPNCGINGCF